MCKVCEFKQYSHIINKKFELLKELKLSIEKLRNCTLESVLDKRAHKEKATRQNPGDVSSNDFSKYVKFGYYNTKCNLGLRLYFPSVLGNTGNRSVYCYWKNLFTLLKQRKAH